VKFLEIGTDKDYVHFLVQSVPTYCVTKIVTMIKSISEREVSKSCREAKKQLWEVNFGQTHTLKTRLENMAIRKLSPPMSKAREWNIINCMEITNCRSF